MLRTVFKATVFFAVVFFSSVVMAQTCPELTGLQKMASYITFGNTMKVFATVGAVTFGAIFFSNIVTSLLSIFLIIPLIFYKALGYLGSIAMIASFWIYPNDITPYVMLAGCIGLGGMMAIDAGQWRDTFGLQQPAQKLWKALTIIYAAIALVSHNSMVGFIAVMALMSFVGFTMAAFPGLFIIGFENDKALRFGTTSAFVVLIPAVLATAANGSLGLLEVFSAGIFWMATFTAFTGLLILATFWCSKDIDTYFVMQILMILAGVGALYFGSVYNLSALQKIGGTFFVLYLLSKPWDLPKRSIVAWSGIGLATCVGVFLIMREITNNPDQWAKWLLF